MELICLLLVFVALFVFWRKRRLTIVLVAGAVFWLFGSWLSGPIVRLAQVGYDSKPLPALARHTAIVVLGGGTEYDREKRLVPQGDSMDRIDLAAMLYKRCTEEKKRCQVIVSGGNPQNHDRSEADLYGALLVDAGVKRADLILEDQSLDTYENARNTDTILRKQRYDSVTLITSSLHMRRALLAFNAFGLHPQPAVASIRNPKSWWVPHPEGWGDSNSALHELLGIVRFRVWRWLGLY